METFDDLLEQRLDELLGGKLRDRVLKKLGSKTAEGRLNLAAMEKSLWQDWLVWRGEQQIRSASLYDVVEFLRNRVGFDINDDTAHRLVYGNNRPVKEIDASAREEIMNLYDTIFDALANSRSATDAVSELLSYSKDADNKDLVSNVARSLESKFPNFTRKPGYEGLSGFVTPIKTPDAHIRQLFKGVAKMILSTATRKGVNKINTRSENPSTAATKKSSSAKERTSEEFFEELESNGMTKADFTRFGKLFIDGKKNAIVREIDGSFTEHECIKLSRIVLGAYLDDRPRFAPYLANLKDYFGGDDDKLVHTLKRCLDLMEKDYQPDVVEGLLRSITKSTNNTELNSAALLVALIGMLWEAYKRK